MKKFILIILAIIITVSSGSCASVNDEPAVLSREDMRNPVDLPSEELVPPGSSAEGIILTCPEGTVSKNFWVIYLMLSREDGSKEGFYYYEKIYALERKMEDGTWVPVPYFYTMEGKFSPPWLYASRGAASFALERSGFGNQEFVPGRYRAIAFVGSDATPICGYFNIE